jgi:hypothetical protein
MSRRACGMASRVVEGAGAGAGCARTLTAIWRAHPSPDTSTEAVALSLAGFPSPSPFFRPRSATVAVLLSTPQSAAEATWVPDQVRVSPGASWSPAVPPPTGARSASWGSVTTTSAAGTEAAPTLATVIVQAIVSPGA